MTDRQTDDRRTYDTSYHKRDRIRSAKKAQTQWNVGRQRKTDKLQLAAAIHTDGRSDGGTSVYPSRPPKQNQAKQTFYAATVMSGYGYELIPFPIFKQTNYGNGNSNQHFFYLLSVYWITSS